MAKYVRNVAGHKLEKVGLNIYLQSLPNNKERLFIRFKGRKFQKRKGKTGWQYTEIYTKGTEPENVSTKTYPSLTDAVIAANR